MNYGKNSDFGSMLVSVVKYPGCLHLLHRHLPFLFEKSM